MLAKCVQERPELWNAKGFSLQFLFVWKGGCCGSGLGMCEYRVCSSFGWT